MNTRHASQTAIVWPAERFYWATLDASVLPKSLLGQPPDVDRLGYLFEAYLPRPIDKVQAVYLPLGDDQYLACGVEHERLEQGLPPSALTLRPDRVPSDMASRDRVNAESINLLTGRLEPPAVRRERRRFGREAGLLAAALLLIIMLGIGWRSRIHSAAVEDISAQRDAIYRQLYDPALAPPSAQPPAVRLLAELRQLRQTRSNAVGKDFQEPESARMLEALFARWPTGHQVRTESISVTPASITLAVLLPSGPDAQAFISAFAPPEGWESKQPQISSVSDGLRLTLRLARLPENSDGAIVATSAQEVEQ